MGSAVGNGRRALLRAGLPLAAAILAVSVAAATGFQARSIAGTALEDLPHGYFARLYPVFAFAIIYGVVSVLTAAAFEPGRRHVWLVASAPAAVVLFVLACLYPTFGGMVLRAGFMTGSVSFLGGANAMLASAFAAAAAVLVFWAALAVARTLATLRLRIGWRSLAWSLIDFAALWIGAATTLAALRSGIDPTGAWPAVPMSPSEAGKTAALVAAALLPHALAQAAREERAVTPAAGATAAARRRDRTAPPSPG